MFTILPGMEFVSGWLIAHLLAVVLIFSISRTRSFNSYVNWIQPRVPVQFLRRNIRRILFLTGVLLLGPLLSFVMSLEPVRAGIVPHLSQSAGNDRVGSAGYFLLDDLLVAFVILLVVAFISILNALFSNLSRLIKSSHQSRFRPVKIQNLELVSARQMVNLLVLCAHYIRIALIMLVFSISLTMIFSLYPETQGFTEAFLAAVLDALTTLWEGLLSFLPSIVTLVFIILITRMSLKALRFFYYGLQRGKVNVPGIHPELVEPTYQLLRMLVFAFALVAAFPYIPGSSSPVFKGLSLLIGFLVSLGSTSLATNIVSGIVLTYTRGLKIGDRVQIGATTGDVIDRTLLVTRVRTIKNVVVTIPNGMVLQNQIVNYTAGIDHQGLILNTSVTIGYDVPWRQVQQLLITAASQTPYILATPEPFVLKTGLDDSYVRYELNAYTNAPARMANLYSDLHQNILDQFNQAGVEIMSPTYFAMRDGQKITIPAQLKYSGGANGKTIGVKTRPI